MRDFVILTIVFGSIPFCLKKPFVGILFLTWISFMNPHRLSYGIAYDFPIYQVVAIATICGTFLLVLRTKRVQIHEKEFHMPWERETVLLVLFMVHFTVTTFVAFYPEEAWFYWERTVKIIVSFLLATALIVNRQKLKYFLYVIVFSIGFYTAKGGIFTILTGGKYKVWGPTGSFLQDNNDIGMVAVIIIPLLWYLSKEEQDWRLRLILRAALGLSIVTVIGTYARGGFLALCVVMLFLIWREKRHFGWIVALLVGVIIAVPFIPQKYYDRINTIETATEQDDSAMTRINAWKFAWNLALDRPLIGGGFQPIGEETYQKYSPDYKDRPISAHSIYFQVLGDHGFIGLGLFLSLLGSMILSCRTLQRNTRRRKSLSWVYHYAAGLEISLIGYMVAGAFYNRAYVDVLYSTVAVVIVLKVLANREFAQHNEDEKSMSGLNCRRQIRQEENGPQWGRNGLGAVES
jgi:probable O-glycosylation ligase (exosortase A-associated)